MEIRKLEGRTEYLDDEGKLHREDGPAVIFDNGDTRWYLHGERHRLDGPAMEHKGSKFWFRNDKLHREDGPAVESKNPMIPSGYYIDGLKYTEEGFKLKIRKKRINKLLNNENFNTD